MKSQETSFFILLLFAHASALVEWQFTSKCWSLFKGFLSLSLLAVFGVFFPFFTVALSPVASFALTRAQAHHPWLQGVTQSSAEERQGLCTSLWLATSASLLITWCLFASASCFLARSTVSLLSIPPARCMCTGGELCCSALFFQTCASALKHLVKFLYGLQGYTF